MAVALYNGTVALATLVEQRLDNLPALPYLGSVVDQRAACNAIIQVSINSTLSLSLRSSLVFYKSINNAHLLFDGADFQFLQDTPAATIVLREWIELNNRWVCNILS